MGRIRIDKRFAEWFRDISGDIFKFADALNFRPTFQQAGLMDAIQRGDLRVAVKSGQGPGKSAASALVGLWRCLRNAGALTVVTAPTMRQCTDVWMGEVRRHLKRADPMVARLFDVSNTRVTIAGDKDWGVKLVTATKEENAQGYHEPNMTIIFEEASGIPREIVTQFKGTSSNPNCLHLMIGNPNTRDCAFFDCFNALKDRWTRFTWNAEETPESEWFSKDRNRELAEEFGRDSDVYRIRVLGEFPNTDPNCVVSVEDLAAVSESMIEGVSRMLVMARETRSGKAIKQFGMDFARFGGDENTVFRRSGNAIVEWGFWPRTDPNDVVAEAFKMQKKAHWSDSETWYVPDATGIGQGVMNNFYKANKRVLEFHNHAKAVNGRMYENRISEAWFHFAKMVRERKNYVPADPRLIQQLTNRQYFTTRKGRLVLESKDDYMKRGHTSPDRADGLVLAFYDEVEAASQMVNVPPSARVGDSV